jgi:uncharacterized protein (TIGR02270 family)
MSPPRLLTKQLGRDAPFFWFLYDNAKRHARYHPADVAEQIQRMEAYLDALGLALRNNEPVLQWINPEDWGACFLLALLGKRHDRPELFQAALDRLDEKEANHPREIADAFLWDPPQIQALSLWLERLLHHPSPVAREAAITVTASIDHLFSPPILQTLLKDERPRVRARLLQWFGEHNHADQLGWVKSHYKDTDSQVAFAAARAGLLLGDAEGRRALIPFSLDNNRHMLEAVTLIFLSAPDIASRRKWLNSLWNREEASLRVKLLALAITGLPEEIPRLFPYLAELESARAAGEAFTLLTGADIEQEDLDGGSDACNTCLDCDEQERPTLHQRRKQDPFISDWEDDLPLPCPEAVEDWWQHHRSRFTAERPHLAGGEISEENLLTVFKTGNQRQRRLAALHLRLRFNQPWRDCDWPLWLQNKLSS